MILKSIIIIFFFTTPTFESILLRRSCGEMISFFETYKCNQQKPIKTTFDTTIFSILRDNTNFNLYVRQTDTWTLNELATLLKLRNIPYVRNLIDYHSTEDLTLFIYFDYGLVTLDEYKENYEYFSHMHNYFTFFRKLFKGIRDLHRKNIIHTDLQPSNILINVDNQNPIITGFEYSVMDGQRGLPRGTFNYVSPEIFRHFGNGSFAQFSPSNDLYSFGIIMFEVFAHRLPFRIYNRDYTEMMSKSVHFFKGEYWEIFKITSGLIRPKSSRFTDEEVAHILESNWVKPSSRVLEHDVKYKMADFAEGGELEVNLEDYLVYIWVLFGVFIVACCFVGVIIYCKKYRRDEDEFDEFARYPSSTENSFYNDQGNSNTNFYGSKVFAIKSKYVSDDYKEN